MIKFEEDNNLGKVVKSWTTFSEIGNKPITDKRQLTIAGGRHKMSRLCGFIFTSKDNVQFSMAFICKLRSKINRQQKKQVGGQWTIPSRWFFLTRSGSNSLGVVNKTNAMAMYGFDVDKFFNSDLFKVEVPKLQKTVQSGLKQAKEFAESLSDHDEKQLAVEEVNAIELSIPLMKEDRFEDKNYQLVNYKIEEDEDMSKNEKCDEANDEIVSEASKWECEVKKEKEDGEDVFAIYEKNGNHWVATFHNEKAAEAFAKQYPKMKEEYLKDTLPTIEEADHRDPLSHALDLIGVKASTANNCALDAVEISVDDETELDKKIEEAMKEIYK